MDDWRTTTEPNPAAVAYVEMAVQLDALQQRVARLVTLVERLTLGLELANTIAAKEHAEVMAALEPFKRRPA